MAAAKPEQPGPEQPAERVFLATHGVDFADENGRWAQFLPAPELREPNGPQVFRFATTDPAVAGRVAAVDDYGIREVTS